MVQKRRLRPRRIPVWSAAVLGILLAGMITILCLWCQPNRLRDVLGIFLRQPILILLNTLPILLVLACLGCVTRNVFFGAALTELTVCLLSVANRIKIEIREEPVFPRDLALLREVSNALTEYDIRYPVANIAVVVIVFLVLLALGALIKVEKPGEGSWKRAAAPLGAVISAAMLAVLCLTVMGSSAIYGRLTISNPSRMSVIFNETGFPYEFCRMLTVYSVERPQDYSRTEAETWDREPGTPGDRPAVHVICIMNEAFSDLTDQPVFRFGSDPLANLHAIRQEENCLYGYVVVPGFAGGTANTEFDVLTGMQTNALSDTVTSAMRVIDRSQDSLFRVYRADGYLTSFIHPGYSWFYNRQNVYRWLGAEQLTFVEQMADPEHKGSMVSDDYTAGLIEQEFESALSGGRVLFNFTTTIQNHMSYLYEKYGEGYPYQNVDTEQPLSDETKMLVTVYTEGVRDADAMLGRLHDYFAARKEPVVLVFFGDHLPYLGENGAGYRELGLDISQTEDGETRTFFTFETPYVIWANEAAAAALDWEQTVETLSLPQGGSLSAAFLGAAVLELTGRGEEDAWFRFLNSLRRLCPVVHRDVLQTAEGDVIPTPETEGTELGQQLSKWRNWSYYRLRQKILQE